MGENWGSTAVKKAKFALSFLRIMVDCAHTQLMVHTDSWNIQTRKYNYMI